MCRLCPVPEWGDPLKVPVVELPAFFAKQISWNFERLNFGNGAVIDTSSGRAERPTITGKVGCKLKEGMRPLHNRSHVDRYLLVSECLFCPGRRYGCTPRANCTGKRRHCYAQCKVSVYADDSVMSEIYFSGSHGTGNVTDVNKHRVSTAIKNELKRKRMDGASTDEALMWFKKYVEDQGLNASDPRLVPNDNQIKQMLKRVRPLMRPTMAHPGADHVSVITQAEGSSIPTDVGEQDIIAEEESHCHEANSAEVSWSAVTVGESSGNMSDGNEEISNNGSSSSHSSNTVHVTFTPLNSPLNTPFTMPSSHMATGTNASDVSRVLGQQGRTLYLAQSPLRSSVSSCMSLGLSGGGHKPLSSLSKRQANMQLEGKEHEITTLRHHIHILEQENLGKISRIAELETQLHSLKERELLRLENQIQRLETENLKKDVRILQLEKQFQARTAVQVLPQPSKSCNSEHGACEQATHTVVVVQAAEHNTDEDDASET